MATLKGKFNTVIDARFPGSKNPGKFTAVSRALTLYRRLFSNSLFLRTNEKKQSEDSDWEPVRHDILEQTDKETNTVFEYLLPYVIKPSYTGKTVLLKNDPFIIIRERFLFDTGRTVKKTTTNSDSFGESVPSSAYRTGKSNDPALRKEPGNVIQELTGRNFPVTPGNLPLRFPTVSFPIVLRNLLPTQHQNPGKDTDATSGNRKTGEAMPEIVKKNRMIIHYPSPGWENFNEDNMASPTPGSTFFPAGLPEGISIFPRDTERIFNARRSPVTGNSPESGGTETERTFSPHVYRSMPNRKQNEMFREADSAPRLDNKPEEETKPDDKISSFLSRSQGKPLGTIPGLTMLQLIPHLNIDPVRIHTDSAADNAAKKLGARAFSLGADIFFRSGKFNPESVKGMALLAHELVHVRQAQDNSINAPYMSKLNREQEAIQVENGLKASEPLTRVPAYHNDNFPGTIPTSRFQDVHRDVALTAGPSSGKSAESITGHQSIPTSSMSGYDAPALMRADEDGDESETALPPTVQNNQGAVDDEDQSRRLYRNIERRIVIEKERRGVDR
jgi:hypothetical protein